MWSVAAHGVGVRGAGAVPGTGSGGEWGVWGRAALSWKGTRWSGSARKGTRRQEPGWLTAARSQPPHPRATAAARPRQSGRPTPQPPCRGYDTLRNPPPPLTKLSQSGGSRGVLHLGREDGSGGRFRIFTPQTWPRLDAPDSAPHLRRSTVPPPRDVDGGGGGRPLWASRSCASCRGPRGAVLATPRWRRWPRREGCCSTGGGKGALWNRHVLWPTRHTTAAAWRRGCAWRSGRYAPDAP